MAHNLFKREWVLHIQPGLSVANLCPRNQVLGWNNGFEYKMGREGSAAVCVFQGTELHMQNFPLNGGCWSDDVREVYQYTNTNTTHVVLTLYALAQIMRNAFSKLEIRYLLYHCRNTHIETIIMGHDQRLPCSVFHREWRTRQGVSQSESACELTQVVLNTQFALNLCLRVWIGMGLHLCVTHCARFSWMRIVCLCVCVCVSESL